MGLFGKKKEKPLDFSYISEISSAICKNDPGVMKSIEKMLGSPEAYFAEYSDRYEERFIDVEKDDEKTLYWIGMTDELIEGGYVVEFDYKCDLQEFLQSIQQLKSYPLIAGIISGMTLDENENIEAWGEEISLAIEGRALLCMLDIDSDSYPLFILPFDKKGDNILRLEELAHTYGHTISEF